MKTTTIVKQRLFNVRWISEIIGNVVETAGVCVSLSDETLVTAGETDREGVTYGLGAVKFSELPCRIEAEDILRVRDLWSVEGNTK